MPQQDGVTYYTTIIDDISWTLPDRYRRLQMIGNGTFGAVCRAVDKKTGRRVAVKKIAGPVSNALRAHHTYREIRILRQIDHENIIDMIDLFTPDGGPETLRDIYTVSSLMDADLHGVLQIQTLSEDHICFITYQILCGLKYLHSAGIIHRDLKPNNIGLDETCRLRILDFGQARPAEKKMSEYVTMRWYRAPEIMYNWIMYGPLVDIWSLGCILAEMLGGKPLFPGQDQMDQFRLICTALGAPNEELVNRMISSSARAYIRGFPDDGPKELCEILPGTSAQVRDLLSVMLVWDPDYRISAEEALDHPFVESYHDPSFEPTAPLSIEFPYEQGMYTVPEWKSTMWAEIRSFQEDGDL